MGTFPHYLPRPNEAVLKWIGENLKASRGTRTVADIAKSAKVTTGIIEGIENGVIHQNLGQFLHIVRHGYHRKLMDLLPKCYELFKEELNPTGKRHLQRDYYYAVCLKPGHHKLPTPLLVAGDPENFLWAVPFRKLKNQPLTTDLLELAPKRTRNKTRGETPDNSHDGVEIVHVINGTVTVTIETDAEEDPQKRTLKAGDIIHFNSKSAHSIRNETNTTPALLHIVRLPEVP